MSSATFRQSEVGSYNNAAVGRALNQMTEEPMQTQSKEIDLSSPDARSIASMLTGTVKPAIRCAEAAFRRDLDEMLKSHLGAWVAYSADERIGLADAQPTLVAECLRRGLKGDEFIVFRVLPEMEEDVAY